VERVKEVLRMWKRVSALLGNLHAVAWLTTSDWAILAKEVNELPEMAGINLKATNANFKQMYVGKNLLLRNSGTDDQGVVNAMNWIEIGEKFPEFDWRRRNWQTGNAYNPHDFTFDDHPFEKKIYEA
jgi:hypothetical protein